MKDDAFYRSLIAKCKVLGFTDADCRVDGTGLMPAAEGTWSRTFNALGTDEALNIASDITREFWFVNYGSKGEGVVLVWSGTV